MTVSIFSEITGVGHYIPQKTLSNDDLSQLMDTSDAWIRERSGIHERHIADLKEGTSDLGLHAAKEALKAAGMTAEDPDLILAATLSPDYYFPGIGVMIQDKLGARDTPAMDIRGQCSGFSWCLATADAFIRSGQYRTILVIGAEIHSRIIEFSTRGRNVSVLFGDAAGAAVLRRKESPHDIKTALHDPTFSGLIDHEMGSDGSGADLLAVTRPGCSSGHDSLITTHEAENKAFLPVMDGKQVFRHAVNRMSCAVTTLLNRHDVRPEQIDLFIPHQANIRINDMVRQKLALPPEKVFNNIHKYGNTTSATIPLCMYEAEKEGRLKKGNLLVTAAFGSGFTWGANLLRW
ncbi:MAG: ketoacyl-ACP synthase III [Deltaproteobacteria bacterium]|nr:ketoacyl-ACP synthase III [Deltaproteobacteria bacterium]